MEKVRSEAGVLQSDILLGEKTRDIVFVEIYEGKTVLDARVFTPHLVKFGKDSGSRGVS